MVSNIGHNKQMQSYLKEISRPPLKIETFFLRFSNMLQNYHEYWKNPVKKPWTFNNYKIFCTSSIVSQDISTGRLVKNNTANEISHFTNKRFLANLAENRINRILCISDSLYETKMINHIVFSTNELVTVRKKLPLITGVEANYTQNTGGVLSEDGSNEIKCEIHKFCLPELALRDKLLKPFPTFPVTRKESFGMYFYNWSRTFAIQNRLTRTKNLRVLSPRMTTNHQKLLERIAQCRAATF
jgi:hypothetical protein